MAKRAGIILDGPIVEKLRFLRMGITIYGNTFHGFTVLLQVLLFKSECPDTVVGKFQFKFKNRI